MRLFGKVDGNIDRFDRPNFWLSPFDRQWFHVFPTLSRSPSLDPNPETIAFDPTIRSEMESGDIKTRPRFTATKEKWTRQYRYMTAADKALMKTLQTSVMVGSDKFQWVDTIGGETHFVRFEKPIVFESEPREPSLFSFNFTVIKV